MNGKGRKKGLKYRGDIMQRLARKRPLSWLEEVAGQIKGKFS